MSKVIGFVSLGCAKNQVNCEQMMALCREAGYEIRMEPEEADVLVINTCGFLGSACEEAIERILQAAQDKAAGRIGKILVTGCMSQRYQEQVLAELPEVDGILGTGSYEEIVQAVTQVLESDAPVCRMGDIHTAKQGGARILSTPAWYAYLRIAEGCDNHCAYCIIPSLRGRYRSRPMEELVAEAEELAACGVKELLIVAQDITRYGLDLYGKRSLAELLRRLCKLDIPWIRLHYLYPHEIDGELLDVIAGEEKILPYLDIPMQHCNDEILRAMNRRDTKASLLQLVEEIRRRVPGAVLRTSIITGLPGEDEAAFEELSEFLRQVRIERTGVFPFSPEEGTAAAEMDHVDAEEAQRRADRLVDVASDIIDAYHEEILGEERTVLCEGYDEQAQMYFGRSYAESPEIDGRIYIRTDETLAEGSFVTVRLVDVMDGELIAETVE